MKKSIFFLVLLIFLISAGFSLFVIYKYNLESQQNVQLVATPNIFVCHNNDECIPNDKLLGVHYLCEEGRCIEKVFSNPASTNCQEKGGRLDLRKYYDERSYGVCIFDDGSECEEWKFLKGNCSIGQFNIDNNIWEGNIINLENNKYINYFEMLNGDRASISSNEENIQNILSVIHDENNTIKVSGIIIEGTGYNNKQLDVIEIIDLGAIKFNIIDDKESSVIASRALMESDNYIKDKGSEIELFKIDEIDCPYCWSFDFSYFIKKIKEYRFYTVIVQEGEIKDISEIDKSQFNDCKEFALAETCTAQYDPVCGAIKSGDRIELQTFSNACRACTYSIDNEYIRWYKIGDCN